MSYDHIEIVYVHSHDCSRSNQEYVYRPNCYNGVAHIEKVVCIETGIGLELKTESTY